MGRFLAVNFVRQTWHGVPSAGDVVDYDNFIHHYMAEGPLGPMNEVASAFVPVLLPAMRGVTAFQTQITTCYVEATDPADIGYHPLEDVFGALLSSPMPYGLGIHFRLKSDVPAPRNKGRRVMTPITWGLMAEGVLGQIAVDDPAVLAMCEALKASVPLPGGGLAEPVLIHTKPPHMISKVTSVQASKWPTWDRQKRRRMIEGHGGWYA